MKLLITTFCLVFLAELGDKTQLATMLMATKTDSIWVVFLGSSIALITASLLGVLAGSILAKYVPTSYIQTASGLGFILIGILLLTGRL